MKMFLGGRGVGKTTCEGAEQYRCMHEMPRSRGFLSASTYGQILNNTLPGIERKWQEMDLVEGEDYVVGIKPPRRFERCLDEPRRYENVISFSNGRRIVMMSMDRPDLARGGTFTDGAVDEAALTPYDAVARVMLPSLRMGLLEYNSPARGSMRFYTSIPWKPSGYWTLDYEEKSQAMPDQYAFIEGSALENIHVLGEDFIKRLEMELPHLEFQVEVMNQRIRKTQDAFYFQFDPDKHTYTPGWRYGEGERGITTLGAKDSHYKPNEVIDLSFDFSGWFNCATAWQQGQEGRRLAEYMLSQFFVKDNEGKVSELIDKVCVHFARHAYKYVRLWGEPRGHDKRPDTVDTIYQQIVRRFGANGWKAEVKVPPGQVKAHKERLHYINEVFGEANAALPIVRINAESAKDCIIALQVTEVSQDFQKNKSKEKERSFPQQHAPHFTDTVDYFLTQKHGWRVKTAFSRPAMSVSVG